MNEDRAVRYHRLKRRSGVVSLLWSGSFLLAFLWSGGSLALRSAVERVVTAAGFGDAGAWPATGLYVGVLALLLEIGGFPTAFYGGFILERRYGLSRESLRGWLKDQVKAFAVGAVLAILGASVVYACIRQLPALWWLPAGAGCVALTVGLANLSPILLLPLFYQVRPLDRESLRVRLLALAERAGARVLGAYVWGLGDKSKKANAALAGLGPTRRILLSDTMLAEYSDDEIEVVLAHELAHHVHGDVLKGLALQGVLIFGGLYSAARVLEASSAAFGLRGPADVAGLPLLLLVTGAVSLSMAPAAHAVSRRHEEDADRFALRLTNNPGAFISAMRRLGAQNLAEEEPSQIVKWLFYSHPPIRERIAAARSFGR